MSRHGSYFTEEVSFFFCISVRESFITEGVGDQEFVNKPFFVLSELIPIAEILWHQ